MADDLEKTEEPTPKKRAEATREGSIASSQEVYTVANLLAVATVLMFLGPRVLRKAIVAFPRLWEPPTELTIDSAAQLLRQAFSVAVVVLIPVFTATVVGGLGAGLLQTRGNISPKKIKPKASKISPMKNASRVFKKTMVIELPKSILKMSITGAAIAFAIWPNFAEYRGLQQLPLVLAVAFQMDIVLKALLAGAVALILVAAIDYSYQLWQTEKSMKMTKSEVADEHKQSQGDPMVRSHMLSMMMDRSRQRMMDAVPNADVIVTNPEHISVAIRYERGEMVAPIVVAKGAGFLALKIRELARESGVPIVENRPLARTLYRSVKIGQIIPETLFQAVAEVLAYIYRVDSQRGRAW